MLSEAKWPRPFYFGSEGSERQFQTGPQTGSKSELRPHCRNVSQLMYHNAECVLNQLLISNIHYVILPFFHQSSDSC